MRFRPSLGTKMGLVASLVLSAVAVALALILLSPRIDLLSRHGGRPLFFVLLIFLTIVSTSTVFILLSRWFVDRPIRELIRIMTVAPSKDFLVRAPVRASDVIGSLARSFNRLLERITTLDAYKMETERQLIMAQEELKFKETLEEKNRIIEKTNADLEARLKELSLLYDFSQQVSMTLEVDELFNVVEKLIGDTLGFGEFAFLVFEEEGQHLVVKVARGFPGQARVRGMSFKAGEGITGRVLTGGKTIYIPDTGLDPDYLYYKGERREDGSFLSIPLVFRKKVVGVLNFFRSGRDRFSAGEIHFLNTLAVELAIALVNARLYSRTRELSVRDELTQLYNRRHFQQILPLEIKRCQRFDKPLSLLMVDIDHFKEYNDAYGHLAGDERLKEFVRLIGPRIREVDFFARFGGEEFVLILPNTTKEDGARVAKKLMTLVQDHRFAGPDAAGKMGISIGLACYPDDAEMMEDLIDAADTALYEAKRRGRGQVAVHHQAGPKKNTVPLATVVDSSRPGR